jgi:hypothetical protein
LPGERFRFPQDFPIVELSEDNYRQLMQIATRNDGEYFIVLRDKGRDKNAARLERARDGKPAFMSVLHCADPKVDSKASAKADTEATNALFKLVVTRCCAQSAEVAGRAAQALLLRHAEQYDQTLLRHAQAQALAEQQHDQATPDKKDTQLEELGLSELERALFVSTLDAPLSLKALIDLADKVADAIAARTNEELERAKRAPSP